MKRRNFLKCALSGLGIAGGLATNLAAFNAFATNTTGYKALVCVFLRGGMDGHDLLIPFDTSSWNNFQTIREPILSSLDASPDGLSPRRLANLIALNSNSSNGAVADGREFAFSQEMREMSGLYHSNKLAMVGNVGPLIEPLTSAEFRSGAKVAPPRLFSHNDQQSLWEAGQPEGATSGWGGRFGDIIQAAGANTNAAFTTVTTRGNSIFVGGDNVSGFALSPSGGSRITPFNGDFRSSVFQAAYDRNLRGINKNRTQLLRSDLMNMSNDAINNNEIITNVFNTSPGTTQNFPATGLGQQLQVVARMIASRAEFGMSRQIFIVSDGGYDTHSDQAVNLGLKHIEISQAMNAFYNETVNLGIENDITTFTASDFGRSLVPNTSGTDHGWGNHHMVMGGAVNGGNIIGSVPPAELGHEFEVGRGRLVPQTSVEQYAYALGRWFGLTSSEAHQALSNLGNFDVTALDGLFS